MSQSHNDGTTRTRDQRRADALTPLAHATSKGKIKGGRSNTKLLATAPFQTITERANERGVTHVGTTLELRIHHPDGSVQVSKPPGAGAPRTDTIGHEQGPGNVAPHECCDSFVVQHKQLTLA